MSRQCDSGDYFEVDSSPIASVLPVSFSYWMWPTNLTGVHLAIFMGDKNVAGEYMVSDLAGSVAGDPARVGVAKNGEAANFQNTGNAYTEDAWNHVFAMWESSSSTLVILNGDTANQATGNPGYTPSGGGNVWDRLSIGRYGDSSPASSNQMRIAHVGIWNAALVAAERAALANGMPPWRVRPSNLVVYRSFMTDDDNLPYIGAALTENGTCPYTANNPPVMSPTLFTWPANEIPATAAPAGAALPRAPFSGPFNRPFGGPFG